MLPILLTLLMLGALIILSGYSLRHLSTLCFRKLFHLMDAHCRNQSTKRFCLAACKIFLKHTQLILKEQFE